MRQAPQYSLAALQPGIYVIGMKDQFNVHDLPSHPLAERVQVAVGLELTPPRAFHVRLPTSPA